ncbi:hypothetical protein [Burkholderia territorii]|nr:hypothetical protein [Burkholderia territorii]
MGIAAYNRGSRLISRQIDEEYRERVRGKSLDEGANKIAWQRQKIEALEQEVVRLRIDLSRARRLIRVLSITRDELRREKAMQSQVARDLKRDFLTKHALTQCYGVIILAKRLGLRL